MTGTQYSDDQYTDDEVRQLFTRATEDLPPGLDLMTGFRARRLRRHRPGTRVLLAAGTATVTAAAAAVTLTAGPAPSARAAVTRAVAATAAQSYRISSTVGTPRQSPQVSQPNSVTVTGAFDPLRKTGEETTGDGYVVRFINGYLYVPLPARFWPQYRKLHPGAPDTGQIWTRLSVSRPPYVSPSGLAFTLLGGTQASMLQLNPQTLLELLRSASEVRRSGPVSGPGWSGTRYSFSVRTVRSAAPGDTVDVSLHGTVDVDQQGRVRRLAATETLQDSGRPRSDRPEVVTSVTITFNGFGLPVPVITAPPQNRVYVAPRHVLLPAPVSHASS